MNIASPYFNEFANSCILYKYNIWDATILQLQIYKE